MEPNYNVVEKINAQDISYFQMPASRSDESTIPQVIRDYWNKFEEQDPFSYVLIRQNVNELFRHTLYIGEMVNRLIDAGYTIISPQIEGDVE